MHQIVCVSHSLRLSEARCLPLSVAVILHVLLQLVGGPRELNDDPDFGTFGGEGQRFGDIGGGGWGGGAGVDDDGENEKSPATAS